MKKYIAEMFGTFILVLFGCGSVVFSAPMIGQIGIAFSFGFAMIAMAYAIGGISGAHINPAVTLGVFASGRMSGKSALGYIVFQFIGAILASYILYYMAKGNPAYEIFYDGLGQNGWSLYSLGSAITFELIATFLFVKVVLKVTECNDLKIAGVVIGVTLTLIHLVGMPITGVSVNPARSFGPALVAGGMALAQVWMFLLIPSIAGILAGLTSRCCCCCCCCKEEEKAELVAVVKAEKVVAPKKVAAPKAKADKKPAKAKKPAKKAK